MNYGYGDGGYFFLQPLTTPRRVVSSYGDGGYFFLQPLTSPRQVVSSYGYAGSPRVYVTSSDEACKAQLKAWEVSKTNPFMKKVAAELEEKLIASGCLKRSGGGSKPRPQGDTNIDDKSAASLGLDEDESFLSRYKTPLLYGAGALAVGALGYGIWRLLK